MNEQEITVVTMDGQEITIHIGGIGKLTRCTIKEGSPEWWSIRAIQFRHALTVLAQRYGMHVDCDGDGLMAVYSTTLGAKLIPNLLWDNEAWEYINGYAPPPEAAK